MATEKFTEVLSFEIEQGDAISEMEKTKKSIIGLREEAASLQKAYKSGSITLEEYAKESVRVEQILKSQTNTYSKLTHQVQGTKSWTDKLTDSFKQQANQTTIAGTNIGQLTTKITSFLNPVTAAVGVVGALGAAYAKSAAGAKDLEFVSNQLSATTQILANQFGDFISSSEDGEGFLTKAFNSLLGGLGPAGIALSEMGRAQALAIEALQEQARNEVKIRGEIQKRLGENAELMAEIADSQTSTTIRAEAFKKIQDNIKTNASDQVEILNKQLASLRLQSASAKDREAHQNKISEKESEIKAIEAGRDKQLSKLEKMQSNMADAAEREAAAKEMIRSEEERMARIATLERNRRGPGLEPIEQVKSGLTEELKLRTEFTESVRTAQDSLAESTKKNTDTFVQGKTAELDALKLFSSEAGRLYATIDKESRFFAGLQLAIDAGLTLSGIEKNAAALKPNQARIYKAAAFLSATASFKQAAQLIGGPAPKFGSGGVSVDAFSTPEERKDARRQVTEANVSDSIGVVAESAGVGAAIGSLFGPAGTLIGGAIGAAVGVGRSIFRNRKRAKEAGFDTGGYTGPGDVHQEAGIVHAGEVVWSQKDVARVGGPAVADAMRPTFKGYADGGVVAHSTTTVADQNFALVNAFKSLPPNVLDLAEFTGEMRKIQYKQSIVNR
jgi:hypothetical protein